MVKQIAIQLSSPDVILNVKLIFDRTQLKQANHGILRGYMDTSPLHQSVGMKCRLINSSFIRPDRQRDKEHREE